MNAEGLVGASASTYLGDLNGHSWRGRRRRESFVPFSVFPIPFQFFLCIFLTREGRWFRPALKPLAGAHAWINGWRGQKSRSGLLEFSFGVGEEQAQQVFPYRILYTRYLDIFDMLNLF